MGTRLCKIPTTATIISELGLKNAGEKKSSHSVVKLQNATATITQSRITGKYIGN